VIPDSLYLLVAEVVYTNISLSIGTFSEPFPLPSTTPGLVDFAYVPQANALVLYLVPHQSAFSSVTVLLVSPSGVIRSTHTLHIQHLLKPGTPDFGGSSFNPVTNQWVTYLGSSISSPFYGAFVVISSPAQTPLTATAHEFVSVNSMLESPAWQTTADESFVWTMNVSWVGDNDRAVLIREEEVEMHTQRFHFIRRRNNNISNTAPELNFRWNIAALNASLSATTWHVVSQGPLVAKTDGLSVWAVGATIDAAQAHYTVLVNSVSEQTSIAEWSLSSLSSLTLSKTIGQFSGPFSRQFQLYLGA